MKVFLLVLVGRNISLQRRSCRLTLLSLRLREWKLDPGQFYWVIDQLVSWKVFVITLAMAIDCL